MLVLLWLIMLVVNLSTSTSLDCYYHTNTTIFTSLPTSVTCTCNSDNDNKTDWAVFQWNIISESSHLTEVVMTNCSKLRLNLSTTNYTISPLPSLVVIEVDMVELLLPATHNGGHNISLLEVVRVDYRQLEHFDEEPDESDQEMYMYLAIGLGSGLGVALIILISLILILVRRRGGGNNKKVSRAESWRYEPSMYVKPPTDKPKPVYVTPPAPPVLQTSSWSRNNRGGTESSSSTPLLRTKYNLRGVDLVRTSLPSNNRLDVGDQSEEERTEAQNTSTLPQR